MRRMTKRLALAALALLSIGCSESPAGPEPKPKPKVWAKGWHDAGLALSEGDVRAGGVRDLAFVGNRLLAVTYSGKLFLSRHGVRGWDSIAPPGGETIYSIASWDSVFYVGAKRSGQIWSFSPSSGQWSDLGVGHWDSTSVTTLLAWRGGLAAFISRDYDSIVNFPTLWERKTGQWRPINRGWPNPDAALVSLALGDTLYFGTWEVGLWRWTPQDSTWVRLPDPLGFHHPRSLTIHRDSLWGGYLVAGLYRMGMDGEAPEKMAMDTVRGKYKSLTKDALGLLSHRGYLFVGGSNPFTPAVLLPGATSFLYLTDNWCRDDWGEEYICQGSLSPAFAALGDTVYAAGGGRIMKIGLSDLPR